MQKKTILLTGATGYLGSHLLKNWISKGHRMVVFKRSTSSLERIESSISKCAFYDVNQPEWERAFEENNIDVIVHSSASYGRKGESIREIVEANTVFPLQLLDVAIKNGVNHFINTASSLPSGINAYSLSKAHFTDWLALYQKDIHYINLVLEYFYGPGDDEWKFITMVINKLMKAEQAIDFTSGNQKRDFIYIDDVVFAYDCVLNNLERLEKSISIQVGTGRSNSLRYVVELCKEITNNSTTKLNFGSLPERKGEIEQPTIDTTILKNLGWNYAYSIENGIKAVIERKKFN